jgi:hypothetical protein
VETCSTRHHGRFSAHCCLLVRVTVLPASLSTRHVLPQPHVVELIGAWCGVQGHPRARCGSLTPTNLNHPKPKPISRAISDRRNGGSLVISAPHLIDDTVHVTHSTTVTGVTIQWREGPQNQCRNGALVYSTSAGHGTETVAMHLQFPHRAVASLSPRSFCLGSP